MEAVVGGLRPQVEELEADGTAGWPTPRGVPPFDQRGWPVLGVEALPTLPATASAHATWKAGCSAVGLVGTGGSSGGTEREELLFPPYALIVHHAGYGGGYGGRRPVESRRAVVEVQGRELARLDADQATGWEALPGWLRSEASGALRLLWGSGPPG